jgi:hypothetical protein
VLGHEVDRGGRDVLRRHDQVALILAIGIVHHDDHFPFADIRNDRLNAVELLVHVKSQRSVD